MTDAERDQMRGMFPYADNQATLLGQFRIAQARECLNRPVVPTVQEARRPTSSQPKTARRQGRG